MNRVSPQTLLFRWAAQAREREGESDQQRPRHATQMRKVEIDRLVDRYQTIRNIKQVAQEFGISRTSAAKHLANRGVDTSRGMSTADIHEATRLYLEGLSSARIGHQLGFDNHTVLNGLRTAGVPVRQVQASRAVKS